MHKVDDVFNLLDREYINPSRDFATFMSQVERLPECSDTSHEEIVMLISFMKGRLVATKKDFLLSSIWNFATFKTFTSKLPPHLFREVYTLVKGNEGKGAGTVEQWEPVLEHLMNSLDFHRNSATYSMERFL